MTVITISQSWRLRHRELTRFTQHHTTRAGPIHLASDYRHPPCPPPSFMAQGPLSKMLQQEGEKEIRLCYMGRGWDGVDKEQLIKSRQAQRLQGQCNFSSVKYRSSSPASEACPGFLCCQGHIAQPPVGVLQPWKEAQAVGLPGPAGLPLKDTGECHSWVNSPSNDLSEICLVCFSVCPP